MLKKNSIFTGVLVSLIFPVIACVAAYLLRNNITVINKPALPYFVAVAINMVLIRVSLKKELELTGKGLMLATFVIMLLIFILKIQNIR